MIQPADTTEHTPHPVQNATPPTPEETLAHTPASNSTGVTTDVSPAFPGSTATSPDMPGQIGDYQLIQQLGRGGMGVVYLARHQHLHQLFAIKMLRDQDYSGSQSQRFLHEAQVVADLKHPGIVQVHHFAIHENQPYLVMEYLPEGSLDKKLKTSLYSPRDAAALVATLAEAMQAAHDKKIIHRDLKPANILLGSPSPRSTHDSAPTTLTPKITDFGLARRTDLELTREFSYLGTPPYMSPEQARGQLALVNERSDIYALGAILYEMLTGRPPFRGSNDIETMRLVCDSEVVPVRTLQPKVPVELETICLHCLQKDQNQRYASATALKNDLQAFLDNRSISVRPIGSMTKAWRWCKRNPTIAGLSGSIAALLIAGISVALWLAYWAFDEQHKASEALKDRELALIESRKNEENARNSAEIAKLHRDRLNFNMRYLVDLSTVGRFLCTDPLRNDFQINVAIVPYTPPPMPADKKTTSNGIYRHSPYLFPGRLPLSVHAMWQPQDQPPVNEATQSSSIFPRDSGLPPASGQIPAPPSTTASSNQSLTGPNSNISTAGGAASGVYNTGDVGFKMTFPRFSATSKYTLEVKADRDCYITVLLIQPQKRQCLVVYPNEASPSVLVEKDKKTTLLNDARTALQPNVSSSPEFLYVIATSLPWTPEATSEEKQGPYRLIREKETSRLNQDGQPMRVMESTGVQLSRQIDSLVKRSQVWREATPASPPAGTSAQASVAPAPIPRAFLCEDVHLFHAFPTESVLPATRTPPEPKKADTKPPA